MSFTSKSLNEKFVFISISLCDPFPLPSNDVSPNTNLPAGSSKPINTFETSFLLIKIPLSFLVSTEFNTIILSETSTLFVFTYVADPSSSKFPLIKVLPITVSVLNSTSSLVETDCPIDISPLEIVTPVPAEN